jgi:Uncharacterized conserved protein
MSTLKSRIVEDIKSAMRAGERDRLQTLRLLQAAVRQREVDERIELDDAAVIAIVEKQVKQRREAERQFLDGGRPELAEAEAREAALLTTYLPAPLDEAELYALIAAAISETAAAGPRDMGKVMAWLKPRVAGRADMGALSGRIKARLG